MKQIKQLFRRLLTALITHVDTPSTIWCLVIFCFLEAFILPLSPLVLLVPMVMAKPTKAWRFVMYATLGASIGALVGYGIGYRMIDVVMPYVIDWGYLPAYQQSVFWFTKWGGWMLLISSITPLPFKFFTWASGSAHFPFIPFILIVLIVRWIHFALIPVMYFLCRGALKKWQ